MAVAVARSIGTVNVTFSTGGAYGTAAYVSLWRHLPHRNTDSDEFSLPGFPETCRFHRSQLHKYLLSADGNDEWSKLMGTQITLSLGSYGWLCNTTKEIEPLGLDIFEKYTKLPIWTIGPLLPQSMLTPNNKLSASDNFEQRVMKEPGVSPEKIIKWLHSHSENSVLYISFGSQNTITTSQMMELAMGLEASGKPFIWVIRPPFGYDIKGEFRAEWLPKGFEERMTETKQGLLVHKWAPQTVILSHSSVGAFLSHCGWNSIVESLSQGVPIIGWPLGAEQPYNSKMMVEDMGVVVELTRGFEGRVVAEEVKRVVNTVLEKEGTGGEMKKKVLEIGQKIRVGMREEEGQEGSSITAMNDFVRSILSMRTRMSPSAPLNLLMQGATCLETCTSPQ